MNKGCLAGLLCSLPTISIAADVVIHLPQAPSVVRISLRMPARACRRSRSSTSPRAPTLLPLYLSPGSTSVCRRAVRVWSPVRGRSLHLVDEGDERRPLRPTARRRREADRLPGTRPRLIQELKSAREGLWRRGLNLQEASLECQICGLCRQQNPIQVSRFRAR
jgi:hypothetical protein